ncbi:hypothetical protein BpHYR1_014955 [Brachionus plicatilis]|uniref:Uncharacterized protein n=1 Tax=Brachionus plicatilis TaxID=10195 RepID=A0A3M7Q0F0_BRAPC|nr:hypothetical protein BpHYR1_014955 [Brachionus plicatilis]
MDRQLIKRFRFLLTEKKQKIFMLFFNWFSTQYNVKLKNFDIFYMIYNRITDISVKMDDQIILCF